jgi:hypothetical protein
VPRATPEGHTRWPHLAPARAPRDQVRAACVLVLLTTSKILGMRSAHRAKQRRRGVACLPGVDALDIREVAATQGCAASVPSVVISGA